MTITTFGTERLAGINKPGFHFLASKCHKCGGVGGFSHWPGFTCWRCGGGGRDPKGDRTLCFPVSFTDEQVQVELAKRQAAADKRAAAKSVKAQKDAVVHFEANLVALPVLAEILARVDASFDAEQSCHTLDDSFVVDVALRARHSLLSERQVETLGAAWERFLVWEAAAEPEPEPFPEGKAVTVEGEVLSFKWVDSQFGSTLKFLVKGKGWKVWGSCPSTLRDVEVGDRVRFVANTEVSNDDPTFGFASRPRKGEVLA